MMPVSSAIGMNSAGPSRPSLRMIPAQQRLEAGDGAIFEPHDRLEIDLHFAAIERPPQIGFERQTIGAEGPHRRSEHFDAIAADALAVARRDFGIVQHVFALGMQLRIIKRNADRSRQRHFASRRR